VDSLAACSVKQVRQQQQEIAATGQKQHWLTF
jgi:hypothetical protein